MEQPTTCEIKKLQLHKAFYLTQPFSTVNPNPAVKVERLDGSKSMTLTEQLNEYQKKTQQGKSKWCPRKNRESFSAFVGFDVEQMIQEVKLAGTMFRDTSDEKCSLKATIDHMERNTFSKIIEPLSNIQLQAFRLYPNTTGVPVFPIVSRSEPSKLQLDSVSDGIETESRVVKQTKQKVKKKVISPKKTVITPKKKVVVPKSKVITPKKNVIPATLRKGVIAQGEFQTPPQVARYLAKAKRSTPIPKLLITKSVDKHRRSSYKASSGCPGQSRGNSSVVNSNPIAIPKSGGLKMVLKLGPHLPSIKNLESPKPEQLICKIPIKYYLNNVDRRSSSLSMAMTNYRSLTWNEARY